MSARVDHVDAALSLLVSADEHLSAEMITQTGEAKADVIAVAQVHATLALVEQQRIANLIALGQARVAPGDLAPFRSLVFEPLGEHGVVPTEAVREGLGL